MVRKQYAFCHVVCKCCRQLRGLDLLHHTGGALVQTSECPDDFIEDNLSNISSHCFCKSLLALANWSQPGHAVHNGTQEHCPANIANFGLRVG